jgi:hypothetical protein
MNFADSLEEGINVEEQVLERIHRKYPCAVRIVGKFAPYDIFIPEIEKRIEVKRDHKSEETGNLVIEIEMGGKPSGLTTTRADFWVFDTPATQIWVTPDNLRRCIMLGEYTPATFTGSGDRTSKRAYLIPVTAIQQYASN